ncbi:alpha/beta hydrolase [Vibrio sp.]|uniref:alpha/beta hydrolase n=1 Tax=Vibrio sp. TaxID=678 RepID=UPI003D1433DC
MSDKIYFSTSNKFSLKKAMVSAGTNLHHAIAPAHARRTGKNLLLTPARLKPKHAQPAEMQLGEVRSREGLLKTYRLGQGPVWLMTHGWSGSANQFFPLMELIAAQGFTALAYDHPAHGESEGQHGHIPGFVDGLETILDEVDDLAGVIAHSMGTASALECRHSKLDTVPMLLIAPVLNYVENLFSSIERSGYSMRLFRAIVSEVEAQYQYRPLQSIDPFQRLSLRQTPTIIVHDRQDKFTQFAISERAAQQMPAVELVATEGQGHGRVINCPQVLESFKRLAG